MSLLSCTLCLVAGQLRASNLVQDPSFENGTPNSYTGAMGDGWVVTAGTGAICNDNGNGCGNAGTAHTGVQMGFLDWAGTFNTVAQTLTTVPGQTYTISFFVRSDHENLLEAAFGGSTLFDGTATVGAGYVEYDFSATATSTSTELAFSGQRTVGGVELLDDVTVSAASTVPEPSSWLTLAAGLLLLSSRFRTDCQRP